MKSGLKGKRQSNNHIIKNEFKMIELNEKNVKKPFSRTCKAQGWIELGKCCLGGVMTGFLAYKPKVREGVMI